MKHWIAKEILIILSFALLLLFGILFIEKLIIFTYIGLFGYPIFIIFRITRWAFRTVRA